MSYTTIPRPSILQSPVINTLTGLINSYTQIINSILADMYLQSQVPRPSVPNYVTISKPTL